METGGRDGAGTGGRDGAGTGGRDGGGTGGSDGADTGGTGARDDAGNQTDDGGVGEAGAEGGTTVAPECKRDSDCAAIRCNGEPHCNDDGKCDPGLACPNPDPAHCSVSCVRSGGRASCQPQGLDADGDGHLDAVCASGGGDDCDDKSATTYAGAAEQCDGLDNDCDGKADVEDGLALAGVPALVHESTDTASLGMAASPEGYGVLELERIIARSSASAARLVFIDHNAKTTVVPTEGAFDGEASIRYAQDRFDVFETHGLPSERANILRFEWAKGGATGGYSTYVPPDRVWQTDATGRAFPAFPYDSFNMLYTTKATSTAKASLSLVDLSSGTTGDPTGIYRVDAPAELFAPAMASDGYAWVQASGPADAFRRLTVQFTTRRSDGTLSRPAVLQSVDVPSDGTNESAGRHEALRPQVIATAASYLIGWLSDGGLQLVRFSRKGEEICRSGPVPAITFWGWANSMVARHELTFVHEDAYVVGANSARQPVVVRVDAACKVGTPVPLGDQGAKVDLGQGLAPSGKPLVEVGHPVIASYPGFAESRLGVAWVEPPKANGLHRVMFRKFSSKLCN